MGLRNALRMAAAVLLPLLAACGDSPRVTSNYVRGPLVWSALVDAGKDGPVFVEIFGNPFDGGADAFGAKVRTRMGEAIREREFTYIGDPGQASNPNTHVKLFFGAPDNANGRRLCKGEDTKLTNDPEKLKVRAVFCAGDDLLSDAQGWTTNVTSAEDKGFARLIGDLTRVLLVHKG